MDAVYFLGDVALALLALALFGETVPFLAVLPIAFVSLAGVRKSRNGKILFTPFAGSLTKALLRFVDWARSQKPPKSTPFDWDLIDAMDGHEFERFVGENYFRPQGWNVIYTSKTGDHGVDLIAERGKERIAVQCKHRNLKYRVGNDAVMQVVGGQRHWRCTRTLVVTNSSFTKQAVELAASNATELWDRQRLIVLSNETALTLEANNPDRSVLSTIARHVLLPHEAKIWGHENGRDHKKVRGPR